MGNHITSKGKGLISISRWRKNGFKLIIYRYGRSGRLYIKWRKNENTVKQ